MKDANKYCETFSLIPPPPPPLFPLSLFCFLFHISEFCPSFCPSFLVTSSYSLSLSQPTLLSLFQLLIQHQSLQKSNLSNLSLAGPSTPCCCLFVWSPTNEMCDKATEGVLPGIKTDFCTLKSEQIKNNRALFVVQRECFSPSSIFPRSCTFSSQRHSVNFHISHADPQPTSPTCATYLSTCHSEEIWFCVCLCMYILYVRPSRVYGRQWICADSTDTADKDMQYNLFVYLSFQFWVVCY